MLIKQVAFQYVIELRFKTNLVYYEAMAKNAALIESDYEDWGTDENNKDIVLINKSTCRIAKVGRNTLSIMTQSDTQVADILPDIHKFFALFLEPTAVTEIKRVGVRKIGIYKLGGSYQQLLDNFYDAFYRSNDTLKEMGADQIDDLAYILDSTKDGAKCHVRIGPLKKEQLEQYFNDQFDSKIVLTSESNLYIDVDTYNETATSLEVAEKNVDELAGVNTTMFNDHLSYSTEALQQ